MHRARIVVAALLVLAAASSAGALEVPQHWGKRVVDLGEMISPGAESSLEDRLSRLERETGAQVVVLTIPTLDGDVLEDFSLRVVEEWELGRAGVDDGALLLIVRDDRRLRLEVGYGLEGTIPDILASRILNDVILPRFRQGEIDAGVASGVGAISGLVEGREDVLPPPRQGQGTSKLRTILFVLAFLFIWTVLVRSRRGGGGGGSIGGGRSVIFFPGSGHFGGGGRSSGGGGFGGFSGGGGSFGGGGASSSW